MIITAASKWGLQTHMSLVGIKRVRGETWGRCVCGKVSEVRIYCYLLSDHIGGRDWRWCSDAASWMGKCPVSVEWSGLFMVALQCSLHIRSKACCLSMSAALKRHVGFSVGSADLVVLYFLCMWVSSSSCFGVRMEMAQSHNMYSMIRPHMHLEFPEIWDPISPRYTWGSEVLHPYPAQPQTQLFQVMYDTQNQSGRPHEPLMLYPRSGYPMLWRELGLDSASSQSWVYTSRCSCLVKWTLVHPYHASAQTWFWQAAWLHCWPILPPALLSLIRRSKAV